ncbi:MAG: hypothetical protein OXC54_01510 [Rhodospirillaceae bacterium]|nr:hypothetical protein [Rhodospirillaceae bacterium]
MEYMEYSLNAERADGITDPAYPKKVDAFATWCRAQPEVMHVQAFSDVMKKLNEAMNGGDPSRYRLPDSPELAAQYLLLYELSIPFGRDHNNRIDIGKSATRMTVTLDRLNSEQQRKLDARATDWLEENAPELAAEASGIRLVFAHTVIQNVKGLLYGTVAAMVFISFLLIGIFGSLRIGLISLVPNLIPAVLLCGGLDARSAGGVHHRFRTDLRLPAPPPAAHGH